MECARPSLELPGDDQALDIDGGGRNEQIERRSLLDLLRELTAGPYVNVIGSPGFSPTNRFAASSRGA
jgi:hypothetical protein